MNLLLLVVGLLVVSPFLGMIGFKLSEKTKIPLMLLLIIIGMIFGVSGIFNIFGAESLQPGIIAYSNLISVPIIFIMAGFSMDFDLIKANKNATMKLGFIPTYITIVAVTAAALLYFKLTGFTNLGTESESFNIFGAIVFAFIVVCSAPVLLVPAALKLKQTDKPIGVTMIAGSIIDNYSALPLGFVAIALGSVFINGGTLSILMIVKIILLIIIGIVIMGALGLFIAKLVNKLLLSLDFMKNLVMNNQLVACAIYTAICIVSTALIGAIPVVGGLLKSFNLIFIIMYGASLGQSMNAEQKASMSPNWQKFVLFFALPIMFLGLGGRTELGILLNIKVIGFIAIMFLVNRGIKGALTKKMLKSEGFNKEEQSIGAKLAFFDGAAPVNLSIALAPALAAMGQTDFVALTAAYGIVIYAITIPVGEKMLSKYYKKA